MSAQSAMEAALEELRRYHAEETVDVPCHGEHCPVAKAIHGLEIEIGNLKIQKHGIVTDCNNIHGISGPDSALVTLRDGRVLEIGEEGLNVYSTMEVFAAGLLAEQGVIFK